MTGRPPKTATNAQRTSVKLMAAQGWSHDRIARQLGIARNTLVRYFREELEFGADSRLVDLLEVMEGAAKKGNATAIKWLMKRFDSARNSR